MSAARVIGLEVRAAVALGQACGHRVPHRLEPVASAIAAENPDQVLVALVPCAEVASPGLRDLGLVHREDDRPLAPLFEEDLVAPRGQHADHQPLFGGLPDDPVDMREVLLVRCRGVAVDERQLAVGIRHGQAVELGEDDGLNDGEALLPAFLQIAFRVFARQSMEELPRRVAQIEKRRPVAVLQEPMVPRHAQRTVTERDGWTGKGDVLACRASATVVRATGRPVHVAKCSADLRRMLQRSCRVAVTPRPSVIS